MGSKLAEKTNPEYYAMTKSAVPAIKYRLKGIKTLGDKSTGEPEPGIFLGVKQCIGFVKGELSSFIHGLVCI